MIDEKKLIEILEDWKFKNEEKGYDTAKDLVQEMIYIVNEQPQADKWISCEVEMPKEHDSMFAKFKGTDKWSGGMFEKSSNEVNVTIEFPDGARITRTSHTIDGEWKDEKFSHLKSKVIAWQPLPQPYKAGESNANT